MASVESLFSLEPDGAGFRMEHRFSGGDTDGAKTMAGVIGVIFAVTPTSPGTYAVIHEFGAEGATGIDPVAGLLEAPDGMMYGTTTGGGLPQGDYTSGVLFQLAPSGRVGVLKTFYDGADGRWPQTGVTFGSNGRLYGTGRGGGAGLGVLYRYRLDAVATLARVSATRPRSRAATPATPRPRASSSSTVAPRWAVPRSPSGAAGRACSRCRHP